MNDFRPKFEFTAKRTLGAVELEYYKRKQRRASAVTCGYRGCLEIETEL